MADTHRVDAAGVLLWLYALFVVAAGSRSLVQLATHAARAPLSYALSAAAAVVYAAGFILIRRTQHTGSSFPVIVCAATELAGVLTVGTLSMFASGLFPDPSVWSRYGAGYLFLPLALPIAVLAWLRSRQGQGRSVSSRHPSGTSM